MSDSLSSTDAIAAASPLSKEAIVSSIASTGSFLASVFNTVADGSKQFFAEKLNATLMVSLGAIAVDIIYHILQKRLKSEALVLHLQQGDKGRKEEARRSRNENDISGFRRRSTAGSWFTFWRSTTPAPPGSNFRQTSVKDRQQQEHHDMLADIDRLTALRQANIDKYRKWVATKKGNGSGINMMMMNSSSTTMPPPTSHVEDGMGNRQGTGKNTSNGGGGGGSFSTLLMQQDPQPSVLYSSSDAAGPNSPLRAGGTSIRLNAPIKRHQIDRCEEAIRITHQLSHRGVITLVMQNIGTGVTSLMKAVAMHRSSTTYISLAGAKTLDDVCVLLQREFNLEAEEKLPTTFFIASRLLRGLTGVLGTEEVSSDSGQGELGEDGAEASVKWAKLTKILETAAEEAYYRNVTAFRRKEVERLSRKKKKLMKIIENEKQEFEDDRRKSCSATPTAAENNNNNKNNKNINVSSSGFISSPPQQSVSSPTTRTSFKIAAQRYNNNNNNNPSSTSTTTLGVGQKSDYIAVHPATEHEKKKYYSEEDELNGGSQSYIRPVMSPTTPQKEAGGGFATAAADQQSLFEFEDPDESNRKAAESSKQAAEQAKRDQEDEEDESDEEDQNLYTDPDTGCPFSSVPLLIFDDATDLEDKAIHALATFAHNLSQSGKFRVAFIVSSPYPFFATRYSHTIKILHVRPPSAEDVAGFIYDRCSFLKNEKVAMTLVEKLTGRNLGTAHMLCMKLEEILCDSEIPLGQMDANELVRTVWMGAIRQYAFGTTRPLHLYSLQPVGNKKLDEERWGIFRVALLLLEVEEDKRETERAREKQERLMKEFAKQNTSTSVVDKQHYHHHNRSSSGVAFDLGPSDAQIQQQQQNLIMLNNNNNSINNMIPLRHNNTMKPHKTISGPQSEFQSRVRTPSAMNSPVTPSPQAEFNMSSGATTTTATTSTVHNNNININNNTDNKNKTNNNNNIAKDKDKEGQIETNTTNSNTTTSNAAIHPSQSASQRAMATSSSNNDNADVGSGHAASAMSNSMNPNPNPNNNNNNTINNNSTSKIATPNFGSNPYLDDSGNASPQRDHNSINKMRDHTDVFVPSHENENQSDDEDDDLAKMGRTINNNNQNTNLRPNNTSDELQQQLQQQQQGSEVTSVNMADDSTTPPASYLHHGHTHITTTTTTIQNRKYLNPLQEEQENENQGHHHAYCGGGGGMQGNGKVSSMVMLEEEEEVSMTKEHVTFRHALTRCPLKIWLRLIEEKRHYLPFLISFDTVLFRAPLHRSAMIEVLGSKRSSKTRIEALAALELLEKSFKDAPDDD